MNPIKRTVLLAGGCVFVGIGAIGVAVPVMPTTPFLILAAICFGSSSPRALAWLENNRVFGEYIVNYRTGAGVSRSKKAFVLAFLWLMLGISGFFMRHNTLVLAILLIVGVLVTIHILTLKGKRYDTNCIDIDEN